MKLKNYLASSLLSLLALASACTSEELIAPTPGGNTTEQLPEGAVQFKIDGINSGAVETRAVTGKVIANAQENRVDNLTILVFGSEEAGAGTDKLTFREYWTSEKRTDFICDNEKKTFSLKGMGKYYTATIVVPAELKSTHFVFLTNEPRVFDLKPFLDSGSQLAELTNKFYLAGDDHLHSGHPFQGDGKIYAKLMMQLAASEAIDGIGVPAGYGTSSIPDLTAPKALFEMENNYFGFITDQRETLAMTGVSDFDVTADGQSMGVTLHRNVARLDVSIDGGIELDELKLTNIAAMSYELLKPENQKGIAFKEFNDPKEVQSTFSLMRLNDDIQPKLIVPARSYCYPSIEGKTVVLIGKLADGTTFEIPFADKDTKEPLEVKNNHRYTIHLRRTSDNHIDANIIVENWKVGEQIDVDLAEPDDKTPTPRLATNADNKFATWQGISKVTCMVSDQYGFNQGVPTSYPWLYFSLEQMSSLGLRMYYRDQEVDFPGALFDPKMQTHFTTETADGLNVAHSVMVTQPTVSTQWLKLQNNLDPTKKHVIKVETGNLESMGINAKTPALIAFAETNVNGTDLIEFPQGGFDGPYAEPVADWFTLRGTADNVDGTFTVAGYVLPTAQQLQCIAPDKGWGRFTDYNGANVVKTIIGQDTTVLYSGSKLDRNIIKVVVDRKQTNSENLGTAQAYVNIEATLWHLDAAGRYLRINVVNFAIPGTDAGRLTTYTALTDLFNNKQKVSAGYTRYFPAADAATAASTAYWGEGGCALMFNDNTVWFNPAYTGNGMVRPVMENGNGLTTMKLPAREPVVVKERVIQDIITIGDFQAMTSNGKAITWDDAVKNAPKGYVVPTYDLYAAMVKADATLAATLFPYVAPAPAPAGMKTGATGSLTRYWLAEEIGTGEDAGKTYVLTVNAEGTVGSETMDKTNAEDVRVVYVKDKRVTPEINGRPSVIVGSFYYVADASAEGSAANTAKAWTEFTAPAGWAMPSLTQVSRLSGIGTLVVDTPTQIATPSFVFAAFADGVAFWLSDEVLDGSNQAQADKAYVITPDKTTNTVTLSITEKTAENAAYFVQEIPKENTSTN